jgi:hypothetical protein
MSSGINPSHYLDYDIDLWIIYNFVRIIGEDASIYPFAPVPREVANRNPRNLQLFACLGLDLYAAS